MNTSDMPWSSVIEAYMRIAMEEAEKAAQRGNKPYGAVITDQDGRSLSVARNSEYESCDPSAHAEINAIRDLCRSVGKLKLGGYRLVTNAEPCAMCMACIIDVGIEEVYFGVIGGSTKALRVPPAELAARADGRTVRVFGGILGRETEIQRERLRRSNGARTSG